MRLKNAAVVEFVGQMELVNYRVDFAFVSPGLAQHLNYHPAGKIPFRWIREYLDDHLVFFFGRFGGNVIDGYGFDKAGAVRLNNPALGFSQQRADEPVVPPL